MSWRREWNVFWHEPSSCAALAFLRVSVGCLFIFVHLGFMRSVGMWNLIDGIISRQTVRDTFGPSVDFSVYALVQTHAALSVLLVLHLLVLVLFTIGYKTRFMAWVMWVFTASFMRQNPFLISGYDAYVSLLMLVFAINPGDGWLSLDKVLARRRMQPLPKDVSHSATIATRVFQITFALRYLSSGYYKASPGWKTGETLWQILTNDMTARFDLTFLHRHWGYLGAFSNLTVFFEMFFIPLMLNKRTRRPTVIAGVLLHASIAIVLELPTFGTVMMLSYILFVSPIHWKVIGSYAAEKLKVNGKTTVNA